MIRITIEIVPFGNEERKEIIEQFEIINNGEATNRPIEGNYDVQIRGNRIKNVVTNFVRREGLQLLLLQILKNCQIIKRN